MEKVSGNTVYKKQNGLEQIENEESLLQLEPNFPAVALPQRNERIIYIISYAYNPFTAPWGVQKTTLKLKQISKQETKLIYVRFLLTSSPNKHDILMRLLGIIVFRKAHIFSLP